jgi:hypothetical protein
MKHVLIGEYQNWHLQLLLRILNIVLSVIKWLYVVEEQIIQYCTVK